MMRAVGLLLSFVLILSPSGGIGAGFNYSMWLAAHPDAIVADGRSETTISAEVRDSSGNAVPDGTVVEFTTSMGIIDRTAQTAAGVARARLRSDSNVGTALVSAVVTTGSAVAQLRVDFLEPGTELFDESFVSVSSNSHLGYDTDSRIIDSAGGVKIYHRGLDITADTAQIDVERMVLRAKARIGGDNITIVRGDKRLEASAIYYSFSNMSGVLLTPADDGAQRMSFRGRDLFSAPDEEKKAGGGFDFAPISESSMFIRASSLFIRPGEEIRFRRANFFVDGDKLLSIPLHVEPLSGDDTGVSQVVTYGTEGLRLDVPFYYSLTPSGTGAVRLRHSQPGGWGYYSGGGGWQVDLEQEYTSGGSTEGKFTLNRITSGDWGARWSQRKEFDNESQLYSYIDFPAHKSLYGSLDYSQRFGDYTMSLYLRGSRRQGYDSRYFSSANLQSRPKKILGGAASYAFTTRLFYDSFLTGEGESKLGSSIGLQFYGKQLRFGPGSGLSTSLSLNNDFGGGSPGSSINANANYYRDLGNLGYLGLNYTYSFSDRDYVFSGHRLSADLNLAPGDRWRASLHSTVGLGDGSTSAFGEVSYRFSPLWRLHMLGTYQKFSDFNYSDAEIALARALGQQEVRLIWSQSRSKLRVEFSGLSF